MNTVSQEVAGLFRVLPFDPDSSYLIQKLEGTATVGARMPLNGIPLEPSEIAVIREWITEGALDATPAVPASVVTVTKLTGEYFDPDTDVSNDDQSRGSIVVEYFPIQFVQLNAGYRHSDGIPQNDQQNIDEYFLELHGFF